MEENIKKTEVKTEEKAPKKKGKKVLIIDDIYTTGSTSNECSKVLKQAGAGNVDVLVIAKD